ncbi:pyridoxal-dependent decarboxylase domain-containing protein 1 [Fopius arisanus]|uniref:Pyridoxal-dependent decarboxylase domain-containing protein 1 n=2 Tax=Fopius arisanus TaxID=64838 RepID=A0A9R1TKZ3_9HYME|nr:PREDICTED: pyridoxal-dependent decarboxylase domain-containing protein 1 [Fopius arisanus]
MMSTATMAEDAEPNENSRMNSDEKSLDEVNSPVPVPNENDVGIVGFEAREVISRLEDAVERAADGGGITWDNHLGFLTQSKSPETVLQLIQDLVIHEDAPQSVECDSQDPPPAHLTNLPPLTEAAKLSLVTHSVSAYAVALPRAHAQRLAARLAADTTRWLSHIFRFVDCASSFHEDHLEGLVRVTRLALHRKYPRYMEDGFTALTAAPPLIYSSVAAPLGVVQHLCRQLSLPLHCVRPIPQTTMFGSRQVMDVAALERRLSEDSQSSNVTPLLVLGEVGSAITGHCDNVTRLREICDKYNVWLHLRGHSLAALAFNTSPKDLPSKLADSITLPLGVWLGIPSLPVVTLYRLTDTKGGKPTSRDTTLSLVSGLMVESLSRRLPTLPLWAALQVLGREGIQSRFKKCFQVIEDLYNRIKKFDNIKFLSQIPGGAEGTQENGRWTINDLTTNPVNSPQLFEVISSALVFQYVPTTPSNSQEGEYHSLPERIPPYYDKLNSWLGQILQRDIENVPIELCEIEQYGVAIRICCLENIGPAPSSEDMDNVIACLEQQIEILNATVEHKDTFMRLVTQNDSLHLVEMPGWAGLGGVRYAPPTWIQIMTEQTKEELNRLNMQLVEALRSTDAAFSLGEGADGLACVRFGMVTQDTDVSELLSLVLQVGQEVEASSKLLDTMSEVVKRGIEAAQTDLERENAEKLWQEGILRHVPVVGTLVNWWSPPAKEAGVRGRSLNLQAGVVESTENIYKYHMQLQPNSTSNNSGARTPPQPLIQTPVGAGSQSHSRSSSHSSLQSGKGVPLVNNSNLPQTVVKEEVPELPS